MSEKNYRHLNFTHEEINNLLKKVSNGYVLTKEDYNQLINEIGLDNISVFDGDYNNLLNLPKIPENLSELVNDMGLENGDQVNEKVNQAVEELNQAMEEMKLLLEERMDQQQGEADELMNQHQVEMDEKLNLINDEMELKANKEELFNKDYNELVNKPEIPSIEGLASEQFVEEKLMDLVNSAPEAMDTLRELADSISEHKDVYNAFIIGHNEALNGKVDKIDGFSLVSDEEIARLAEVDNFDDTELKAMMDLKANRLDLFSKDYNELINKPKIPSIEGLATENFVKEQDKVVKEEINNLLALEAEKVKADIKQEVDLINQEMDELALVMNDAIEAEAQRIDAIDAKVEENKMAIETKVEKVEGKDLMDIAEMERLAQVDNFDDTEVKAEIQEKVDELKVYVDEKDVEVKDELLNKVNELDAKVDENKNEVEELIAEGNKKVKEEMAVLLDEESKSINDIIAAEILDVRKYINQKERELKNKIDEQEPYFADLAAYPTSKFLFACGHAMTVDNNKDFRFDANKPEDTVICVYRWADGFKFIALTPAEAAKTYIVGGYGDQVTEVKRSIPQTNILVKNVKIKGIVGGSYFEGMVGHVNIKAKDAQIANIIGGGWCGASVNGDMTRVNIADDVNVKLENVKGLTLVYGGCQGNGVVNRVHMELNNCEAGWVTAGGSNGMTREARIVVNGGKIKVAQSTNRGIVYKADFILNDGEVESLYFGGETEDTSVNGMIDEGFVQLNNGKVNNFKFGTNNGVELTAEDIKGAIVNCVVEEGDISMLDKIDMPENPNVGDCVFNEKLNRPIWFNGKNWVDANGLIVG